jgi:hypothetical protein
MANSLYKKNFLKNWQDYDGKCMHFANALEKELRKEFPNTNIYQLQLRGEKTEYEDPVDVLIHVYVCFDTEFYMDSEGIHTEEEIEARAQLWHEIANQDPDVEDAKSWHEYGPCERMFETNLGDCNPYMDAKLYVKELKKLFKDRMIDGISI